MLGFTPFYGAKSSARVITLQTSVPDPWNFGRVPYGSRSGCADPYLWLMVPDGPITYPVWILRISTRNTASDHVSGYYWPDRLARAVMRRRRRCLSWLRPCPPARPPSDPPHPAAGTPTPLPATPNQGVKSEHSQVQYCGSGMFIPDSNFFHSGSGSELFPSRIRIKEFKYFNTKKWFLSSRKYDPGCSSSIRIKWSKRQRIPNPDPQHCLQLKSSLKTWKRGKLLFCGRLRCCLAWGRLLGLNWNKSLKRFPPCYSQSPLQYYGFYSPPA
jgi:hypothetical protein